MAYTFTKLSDVEVVEAASTEANILIEENGEIKKTPAAILLNQTESVAPVKVSYDESLYRSVWNGTAYADGEYVDFDKLVEDFDNGVDIRVSGEELCKITSIYYDGVSSRYAYYISGGSINTMYFE